MNTAEMALNDFIEAGKRDLPVYISSVRSAFQAEGANIVLDLINFDDTVRRITIKAPAEISAEAQIAFVREYLFAEVYNLLSAVGGKRLDVYVDAPSDALGRVLYELPSAFGIGAIRKERKGYGRCVNVIERMLDSQHISGGFSILVYEKAAPIPPPAQARRHTDVVTRFSRALGGIENKLILGMDIGGTDIKLAASVKGKLCCLKEYDWFPALFTRVSELVEPVMLLVRLVRARISCDFVPVDERLVAALDEALEKHVPDAAIESAVLAAETALGDGIRGFDAVGLCFPDVIIHNKIVGGETFKTRGIRNNPAREYEAEFRRLMDLDEQLAPYLAPGGSVRMTNDGHMAAFAAAIELIAKGEGAKLSDGRFAHTLGTELGTGWIDEDGDIPETPMEIYN